MPQHQYLVHRQSYGHTTTLTYQTKNRWEIWKKWVRIALFSFRIAAGAIIPIFWPVMVPNLISKYSIASEYEWMSLHKEMHEYLVVVIIEQNSLIDRFIISWQNRWKGI